MIHRGLPRKAALAAFTSILTLPLARAGAQSLLGLHLAGPGGDDDAPALYALHAGLFQRAGLDVDMQRVPSGAAAAAAVVGGAVQLGYAGIVPVLAGHLRGVPLQLIAPGSIYTTEHPTQLMLVLADSPIRTGRDLNGKTIGSPSLNDLMSTANLAWIDANGGDSRTVKEIEIPQAAAIAAMEANRIDAVTLIEPRLSQALATGRFRVLGKSFDGIAKRFLGGAWFADADYVAKNPDPFQRFARVMRVASAYANAHPSETAPLVAAEMQVDLQTISRSRRLVFDETFILADLQAIIDSMAKYHVIEKAFPAEDLISTVVRNAADTPKS